jgi:hypothetical protein
VARELAWARDRISAAENKGAVATALLAGKAGSR